MQLTQKLVIAILVVMVALATAWYAGYWNFLVQAIGIASFSIAFIYPQYKSEPGVWMGGLLIMLLTAFMIFTGCLDLFANDNPDQASQSWGMLLDIAVGTTVLTISFVFTAYTSLVNRQLSRSLSPSMDTVSDDCGTADIRHQPNDS